MMTNMFSTFDPSFYFLNSGWISVIVFSLIPISFWSKGNSLLKIEKNVVFLMSKELKFSLSEGGQSSHFFIISLFITILSLNFIALYPQTFSLTSQISVNLFMSAILWLSITAFGWVKSFKKMMVHLVPLGTPWVLMPFMVIIELVSSMIRPITLCVRLTANIVAGHLLMSLLGNLLLGLALPFSLGLMAFPLALTILESAVAVIQAYVMVTLLSLYLNEIS